MVFRKRSVVCVKKYLFKKKHTGSEILYFNLELPMDVNVTQRLESTQPEVLFFF